MKSIHTALAIVIFFFSQARSYAHPTPSFQTSFFSQKQAVRLKARTSGAQKQLFSKPTGLTEAQFNEVVHSTSQPYIELARLHGAELSVTANWSSPTVNASTDRADNQHWSLSVFGGLARLPEMTQDSLTLVLCHELSHQFGGFPFFNALGSPWGSVEGQADYSATHACAKLIWKDQMDENATAAFSVSIQGKKLCDLAQGDPDSQKLCYRTLNAALQLATLLADGDEATPALDTPDQARVKATFEDHPGAQCRLDTFIRGALCTVQWNYSLIPGLNPSTGLPLPNIKDAQTDAFLWSCSTQNQNLGARPACWFSEL